MLLKDDFRVAMDSLKPNVEVMITACDKLLHSVSLKGFLRYVLHAGNFINAVSLNFLSSQNFFVGINSISFLINT